MSAEYVPNKLLSGQTPATVQSLGVRFDQKGHERPYQKAVIVDIQDGYLNPGDRIIIRLGDRRFGGRGTRVQTFIEKDFRWRLYIDPVGTSRFAPIRPDISWSIVAGPPHRIQSVSPRLVQPNVPFAIHAHIEDRWGNVTSDLKDLHFKLKISNEVSQVLSQVELPLPQSGWSNVIFSNIQLPADGDYAVDISLEDGNGPVLKPSITHVSASSDFNFPRPFFGDLHVHSEDTVGTENSEYNFSYGREIAGLDILGYTANDFQITKERWDRTTKLIRSLNDPGNFVIFPGTEWCGNSSAGGDHNVVFLDDSEENPAEFPYDRHGNVARSFEWSEDGPEDLVPGAWPLDEVYATYARDAEKNLLIPHVGGRRCNLSWHHPKLERLVEIGSAWGQFEWLLQDAVQRGWKLGVSANSDEHRGRCGGGVSGTAVFGTRGGLTGVLSDKLDRASVASALRSRHTFATSGQRLVGLVSVQTKKGLAIQGDEIEVPAGESLELKYHFLGERGFSSIEAWDASGLIWNRHFWSEEKAPAKKLRITWGGARLYDRYREAVWNGQIWLSPDSAVGGIEPFGGLEDNPEDVVQTSGDNTVQFSSKTSGDLDGVNISLHNDQEPSTVLVSGSLGGYVKVGDPLAGNPHKAQPTFRVEAAWEEITKPDGKSIEILGGAGLFVRIEAVPDIQLPRRVQGTLSLPATADNTRSVYFVGCEWHGAKVITSPLFIEYR